MILHQDLVGQQDRPQVVGLGVGIGRIRRKPAVGPLVGDDKVNVSFDLGLQPRIVEHPGQRNGAVEPIRGPLPPFGLAAEPLTLRHVRPELVEVPAQTLGLDPQLPPQPARRTDRAQRQGVEHRLCKPGCCLTCRRRVGRI